MSMFLPVVASATIPMTDVDVRAPGFWSRLRARRAGYAGNDAAGRLQAAVAVERSLERRLAAQADRLHRHPYVRAGLLGLAARADHCAQRLTAALGELGASAGAGAASRDARWADREGLSADIDDLRAATERYLDDACAVARHHPWLSRLLLAIRDDKADDLRTLVQLRARLGLDRPDDDGSAPVPAAVTPDLDPVIGRIDIDIDAVA